MFAPLTRLLTALSALADNLTAFSATVAEVNAGLRGRLQLDPAPADVPAVTHQIAQERTDGTPEADGPAGRPKGRRKATETA
jgi:hypothetical protein